VSVDSTTGGVSIVCTPLDISVTATHGTMTEILIKDDTKDTLHFCHDTSSCYSSVLETPQGNAIEVFLFADSSFTYTCNGAQLFADVSDTGSCPQQTGGSTVTLSGDYDVTVNF
jgi:hypothetical protein